MPYVESWHVLQPPARVTRSRSRSRSRSVSPAAITGVRNEVRKLAARLTAVVTARASSEERAQKRVRPERTRAASEERNRKFRLVADQLRASAAKIQRKDKQIQLMKERMLGMVTEYESLMKVKDDIQAR